MSHIRGRFHKAADKLVTEYTASIPFDRGYIATILLVALPMSKCWQNRV